jgi:hypothetical protein
MFKPTTIHYFAFDLLRRNGADLSSELLKKQHRGFLKIRSDPMTTSDTATARLGFLKHRAFPVL